jgi:hypothetical protein
MMANDDYYSQIAQMRAERRQRETAQEVQQLQADYLENVKLRDEAAVRGDADSFEFYDRLAEQGEMEWQEKFAPQQPQVSEAKQQWVERHKSFVDRYGQKGIAALGYAHEYATKPRDPTTTDNLQSGMGLQEDTPEYFEAMERLLEMYGREHGLVFDPNETLTADDVVKMSGITPREYNRAAKTMIDTGHDSNSLYGRQFKRHVG